MLEDNGKIILDCQGCGVSLMTIWRTGETTKSTDIKALCPICGDSSLRKEIIGTFSYSMGNDEADTIFTNCLCDINDDGTVVFTLEK